jgi:hypothetical protein
MITNWRNGASVLKSCQERRSHSSPPVVADSAAGSLASTYAIGVLFGTTV